MSKEESNRNIPHYQGRKKKGPQFRAYKKEQSTMTDIAGRPKQVTPQDSPME